MQTLVMGTNVLTIQPDSLELDIDAITAAVVSAYLVRLPLQFWSRTARSSRILHFMILVWNNLMLAGAICVLYEWPWLNTAPPQYRFCNAYFLNPDVQSNEGWDGDLWREDWNATIYNIFTH